MKDYLVPVLLLLSSALTLGRKEDSYGLLLEGAEEGLRLLKTIIPALVVLLSAVSMLRSSGAMALLENLLAPLFLRLGIPKECALLVLIRPVSGSAALAVGTDLMRTYGVDSAVGRTAAVMLGSTDHLLHHQRLLWRRRNPEDPLHPALCPVCRSRRLCRSRGQCASVLSDRIRAKIYQNSRHSCISVIGFKKSHSSLGRKKRLMPDGFS